MYRFQRIIFVALFTSTLPSFAMGGVCTTKAKASAKLLHETAYPDERNPVILKSTMIGAFASDNRHDTSGETLEIYVVKVQDSTGTSDWVTTMILAANNRTCTLAGGVLTWQE